MSFIKDLKENLEDGDVMTERRDTNGQFIDCGDEANLSILYADGQRLRLWILSESSTGDLQLTNRGDRPNSVIDTPNGKQHQDWLEYLSVSGKVNI